MGNCGIHMWGSAPTAEMSTERKLARSLAEPLEAVTLTYEALGLWERAYIADIGGDTAEANARYEESIETVRKAQSQWKRAENSQSELIMFLLRHDRDVVLRPEVRKTLEGLSPDEHLRNIRSDGRFLNIPVEDITDMVEFGTEFLDSEEFDDHLVPESDADDTWREVLELFQLDLNGIQQMRVEMKHVEEALVECRPHVNEGRLFETLQYSTRQNHLYPVSRTTARARCTLLSYATFVEAYGSYITRAVMNTEAEIWPEMENYVESEGPVAAEGEHDPFIGQQEASSSADD